MDSYHVSCFLNGSSGDSPGFLFNRYAKVTTATKNKKTIDIISKKEYLVRKGTMFDIKFYRMTDGTAPVEEFLDSLNIKMRNKALDSLLILEEFGNTLREPYSKSVGNGLFELRIKFSSDISRIFYFFYTDNRIVVTNGFIKKTQKTPRAQLKLARQYKADYEHRARERRQTS